MAGSASARSCFATQVSQKIGVVKGTYNVQYYHLRLPVVPRHVRAMICLLWILRATLYPRIALAIGAPIALTTTSYAARIQPLRHVTLRSFNIVGIKAHCLLHVLHRAAGAPAALALRRQPIGWLLALAHLALLIDDIRRTRVRLRTAGAPASLALCRQLEGWHLAPTHLALLGDDIRRTRVRLCTAGALASLALCRQPEGWHLAPAHLALVLLLDL